eukprot:11316940-Alexandrium_andersonii.AAC.1
MDSTDADGHPWLKSISPGVRILEPRDRATRTELRVTVGSVPEPRKRARGFCEMSPTKLGRSLATAAARFL